MIILNKYQRKKNETEFKLKEAFFEVAKNNYITNISVINICEKANIARSTFYIHYDNIEDFFRKTATELIHEIEEHLFYPHISKDKNKNILVDEKSLYYYEMEYFLSFLQQNRYKILPFIYPQEDPYFVNNFKQLMSESIDRTLLINSVESHEDAYFNFSLNLSVSGTMFHWLIYEDISKIELLELSVALRKIYLKKGTIE